MSKSSTLGRHRAAPVRTNPLEAISKAVSSNAGSVGRQAAVIAAASGLVLTLGVPAQATTIQPENPAPAAEAAVRTAVESVSVPSTATFELASKVAAASQALTTSEAAPEPEPVPVPEPVVTARPAAAPAAPARSTATAARTTRAAAAAPAAAPAATAGRYDTVSTPTAAPAGASAIVAAAYSGIGKTYKYGGTSPVTGWDCSGFVQWAYAQAGISIPRVHAWNIMTPTSNPKPGDLVVQNGGGHVGIYVGNGQMIGAQNPTVDTILGSVTRNKLDGYYTLNP